jgi:hypothetical protein
LTLVWLAAGFRPLSKAGSRTGAGSMFESPSRYFQREDARYRMPSGADVSYKRQRFLPTVETRTALSDDQLSPTDRLDRIAAPDVSDPERFWRVCDASAQSRRDLTAVVSS